MKKLLTLILGLIIIVGCSPSNAKTKPTIVASVYPAYDFAKRIAGDEFDVSMVVSSGTDAHHFEPTPQDIAKIQKAAVFVYEGQGLESWVESVLKSIDTSKVKVINLSSVSTLIEKEADDHDHDDDDHDHGDGTADVHTWLSIDNAKKQTAFITKALIEVDSAHKATYEKRLEAAMAEFDKLQEDYNVLKTFPHFHILVDHQAYAYLEKDYGFHQESIITGTLSEEPTPAELQASINAIKEREISGIYVNPNRSQKVYEMIAKETGVKIYPLHTLETLTQKELKDGSDYFTIMRSNLKSIKEGVMNGKPHNH